MIFRIIFLLAGLGTAYFIFTSNSGGPQSPLTGAPGETGTSCNMCHGTGNYNTTVDIDLMTQDSLIVSTYQPNQTYIVRLRVSGTNNPKGYGFQLVCLDELTNSNMGVWSKLPSNIREINMLSRKYLVHSSPSTSGLYYFHWNSPTSDKGNIKFYSAGLSANLNGTTTGDKHGTLVKTIPFNNTTSTDDTGDQIAKVIVFPNPAQDFIQTNAENVGRIMVFDLAGKLQLEVKKYAKGEKIDVSQLGKGLYKVMISDPSGEKITSQLIYKG